MSFSGALTLTDLNDFITPSQACIKPVEEVKSVESVRQPGAAATEIHIDSSGEYYEVSNAGPKARTKLQAAEISLNDCLACSGCITSAESVLINMQSHTEVLDFLSRNPAPSYPDHSIPVLSISPQSLASLSASISPPSGPAISLTRILARVRAFCLQKLHIEHTFDTTFARHIALREHLDEFKERKSSPDAESSLPMLASACPGWVCYAEKAHGEMIPFMSRTKSPQQIMGSLVKHWMGAKCQKTPDQMYHVTVMPCYDKKLEASRADFYNEQYATRDVDCVLTTRELELMMREQDWDLRTPVPGEEQPSPNDSTFTSPFDIPDLLQHPGSSSGSYLQHLIDSLALTIPNPTATTRRIRSDYEEYTLTNGDTGEVVFKGAKCYGFRNLQNIVRKVGKERGLGGRGAAAAGKMTGGRSSTGGVSLRAVSRRRAAGGANADAGSTEASTASPSASRGYDYVEVMACPGGCVNGGGQIKAPSRASLSSSSTVDAEGYARDWESSGVRSPTAEPDMSASERWTDKEWVKRVEAAYWNNDMPTPPPSPPMSVASLHASGSAPGTPSAGQAKALAKETLVSEAGVSEGSVADDIADRVIEELFAPSSGLERGKTFRTEYRAVVSEVIGLAVKW